MLSHFHVISAADTKRKKKKKKQLGGAGPAANGTATNASRNQRHHSRKLLNLQGPPAPQLKLGQNGALNRQPNLKEKEENDHGLNPPGKVHLGNIQIGKTTHAQRKGGDEFLFQ